MELDLVERKDTTSAEIGENQLYAEIKDPESLEHPSTSSEVVRVAPDPTPTGPTSHHYDNAVLAEGPSPSGDYQLTWCALKMEFSQSIILAVIFYAPYARLVMLHDIL